jgi:hypothetical protein
MELFLREITSETRMRVNIDTRYQQSILTFCFSSKKLIPQICRVREDVLQIGTS